MVFICVSALSDLRLRLHAHNNAIIMDSRIHVIVRLKTFTCFERRTISLIILLTWTHLKRMSDGTDKFSQK